MKHRFVCAAIAAASAILVMGHAVPAAHAAIPVGTAMPAASDRMKNVDGRDLSLADIHGEKGTLVIFSCNHCPWAKAWEERIVAIGNEYPKKGIGVAVVNSNDPAKYPVDSFDGMKDRARERGMTAPYLYDATSDVARAFQAEHTPEAFLFDASGKLVYHGAIDDNAQAPDQVKERYLRDALDALLAGRAIPTAETKALGCGIKFRAAKTTESGARS
jgi:hypothetical protein